MVCENVFQIYYWFSLKNEILLNANKTGNFKWVFLSIIDVEAAANNKFEQKVEFIEQSDQVQVTAQ
jgi:hypothetical protein